MAKRTTRVRRNFTPQFKQDAVALVRAGRNALAIAFRERQPAAGLLVHSDRGGQNLSATVQGLLDAHGTVPSTSRPGACLDNAVAEGFFHTMKTELVYHQRYPTREAARLGDLRVHRGLL